MSTTPTHPDPDQNQHPWQPSLGKTYPLLPLRIGDASAAVAPGKGKTRPADRAYASAGLAVVADGVGLRPGSPAAADVAVGTVVRELACVEVLDATVMHDVIVLAAQAVEAADLGDAATTLTVAALVSDGKRRAALIGWIGDSPAALVTAGQWRWKTRPHATTVTPDALTDESVPPRSGNMLTQSLRSSEHVDPTVVIVPLHEHDTIVIASDGLLDTPTDPAQMLPEDGAITADLLTAATVALGARDDVAVAVLHPDGQPAQRPRTILPRPRRRFRLRRQRPGRSAAFRKIL